MSQVLVYDRGDFDLVATNYLYLYQFRAPPTLEPTPYLLGDGSELVIGDRFTKIGGSHTSASFRTIDMIAGYLEYAGELWHRDLADRREQDRHVLFRWSDLADPLIFYGGHAFGAPLSICFSTPAVSARLVETTQVVRL